MQFFTMDRHLGKKNMHLIPPYYWLGLKQVLYHCLLDETFLFRKNISVRVKCRNKTGLAAKRVDPGLNLRSQVS